MNNLYIYEQARDVPAEAKSRIKAGRLEGFTDINPMWRIKRLTEIFGPCGIGWWYTVENKWKEEASTGEVKAFVDINLYYKDPETGEPSHGIPGTGGSSFLANEKKGPYVSDECYKMALTDAISVAAKALGIGADVYYEKDRTKYTVPVERGTKKEVAIPAFKGGFMDEAKLKDLLELAAALNWTEQYLVTAISKKFGKQPAELTESEYHKIVQGMTGEIANGKAEGN